MQCYEIEYKELRAQDGLPNIIHKRVYIHAQSFGDAEDTFIVHDRTANIISIEELGPSLFKNAPKPSSQPPGDE